MATLENELAGGKPQQEKLLRERDDNIRHLELAMKERGDTIRKVEKEA